MLISLFASASLRRRGDRLVITGRSWRDRSARIRGLLDDLGLERVSVYRFGLTLVIFGVDAGERQRVRNAFAAERL